MPYKYVENISMVVAAAAAATTIIACRHFQRHGSLCFDLDADENNIKSFLKVFPKWEPNFLILISTSVFY